MGENPKCPRLAHCKMKSRCTRREWLLFTPHNRTEIDAVAAIFVLRARSEKPHGLLWALR
ncbi:hypothetical protein [Phaeobacter inhibens]|uniref:hypothetical protein n=1 Tax=Phaeobacter inhibens TaxID=221822 RepID=UPI000C9CF337|nr:hypothetical protein [Phaeobacter inhibens]